MGWILGSIGIPFLRSLLIPLLLFFFLLLLLFAALCCSLLLFAALCCSLLLLLLLYTVSKKMRNRDTCSQPTRARNHPNSRYSEREVRLSYLLISQLSLTPSA